jgi:hypothetical protein
LTAAASNSTVTLDTTLTIPKGTTKTVSMKCDVAGNAVANDWYTWGLDSGQDWTPVGKTSGTDVSETLVDNVGPRMTIGTSGTYTVAEDSTPGYTIVSAGQTGVTLLKLKFSATTEDIDIYRVAFRLTGAASNTPLDLVDTKVTLWDGATKIGEAIFSTGDYATSTLLSEGAFRVPTGGSKTMTIKGDIAAISGTVGPLTASGDLLIVNYDGADNNATTPASGGNYGKGQSSGSNINTGTASLTDVSGVRIMKAYPTFAKVDLSTSERLLQTKSGATLYKFKVTANAGDVYAYKFTFQVSSSTVQATTTLFGVYVFTDSAFSSADNTFSSDGLLNANRYFNGCGANSNTVGCRIGGSAKPLEIYPDKSSATTTYKIPSGESRWFELRGDVSNVETGSGTEYITIQLEGDAVYPANAATLMNTAANVDADTNDDFVWSPSSTSTTMSILNLDFTNGYGIVGLPTTNMLTETLTSAN